MGELGLFKNIFKRVYILLHGRSYECSKLIEKMFIIYIYNTKIPCKIG